MENGCNNVTPQEETRGNREYKPQPKLPKYTFYSPMSTRNFAWAVVAQLLVPRDP